MAEIEKYKGRFRGRVWVLGNTLSLADDCHKLAYEVTFGSNFLMRWRDIRDTILSTLVCVTDSQRRSS